MNSCESVQDKTAELQTDYAALLKLLDETGTTVTADFYTNNAPYAMKIYANGYVKHNIILFRDSLLISA